MQKNVFVPEMERGVLKRIFYAETLEGDTMRQVIVQEFTEGKLTPFEAQAIVLDKKSKHQGNSQWNWEQ